MKRILSLLLALILALSLAPVAELEAKAEETDVYTLVEQQIKAYASSINQNDAAKTAATALLTNAAFRGKDLSFDESSAMTAMIFNSYLFQDGLSKSIANLSEIMQQMNRERLSCGGDVEWRAESNRYTLYAYHNPGKVYSERIGLVASSKEIYGTDSSLLDYYNSNDKMLVMVAGGMQVDYTVTRLSVSEYSTVYSVDVHMFDDFDFDGEYNESQYNRDFEELLTIFGKLTLREFSWEADVSFQVEVPYSCEHTGGSYHWIHMEDGAGLVSDASDGFLYNPPEALPVIKTSADGSVTTSYFYKLADPIFLYHDSPWVVEYEMKGWTYFLMTPFLSASSTFPLIFQYSRDYSWIGYYEKVLLTEEEMSELDSEDTRVSVRHFYGPSLPEAYQQISSHTYCYRMENVVAEDGSNMVYLSIYDYDLDQTVFGPEPMDDHRSQLLQNMGQEWELHSTEDDWLNGKDIIINYIGGSGIPLNNRLLSIRIHENGDAALGAGAFLDTVVEPTCFAQGYTAHTCTKCGYTEKTDFVEMLPHDYREGVIAPTCTAEGYTRHICTTCGYYYDTDSVSMLPHDYDNYVSNNDATCAHDGTKTGKCTVCGATDTVADEGTALPHDWADATCTKAQTCKVCGGTEGDPLGHDLKFYNAKAPTCTDLGWDAYEKCQRCRYSTFATMPALGHDYVNGVCRNCGDGDVLPGDLNGDGEIDIFDANLIVAYYNGTAELSAAQQKAADVNGDGEIDIFDANLIVSHYNGTLAAFPAA